MKCCYEIVNLRGKMPGKRYTNKEIIEKLEKIESKLDTIDNEVINKKLKKIHNDLLAHDKETYGQYFQTIGFAVMAIAVAFLITASQTDPARYLTGFILFFIAMPLMILSNKIGDFAHNFERKRREKKAKKDKK